VTPVTVQLRQSDGSACWEATYATARKSLKHPREPADTPNRSSRRRRIHCRRGPRVDHVRREHLNRQVLESTRAGDRGRTGDLVLGNPVEDVD